MEGWGGERGGWGDGLRKSKAAGPGFCQAFGWGSCSVLVAWEPLVPLVAMLVMLLMVFALLGLIVRGLASLRVSAVTALRFRNCMPALRVMTSGSIVSGYIQDYFASYLLDEILEYQRSRPERNNGIEVENVLSHERGIHSHVPEEEGYRLIDKRTASTLGLRNPESRRTKTIQCKDIRQNSNKTILHVMRLLQLNQSEQSVTFLQAHDHRAYPSLTDLRLLWRTLAV